MAKQRRTEKKLEVPLERRTTLRGAGREQPKEHSSGHRESMKSKKPGEGAQGQKKVEGKDIQEGWEPIKEIDKVLDHLEGRLDKVTAAI